MADVVFFPAPAPPMATADTVVAGRAGGAAELPPWPEGLPVTASVASAQGPAPWPLGMPASSPPLPPASEGVSFFRTPVSVGQEGSYIGALGAAAQIPASTRNGLPRSVLLDSPAALIFKSADDRAADAERGEAVPLYSADSQMFDEYGRLRSSDAKARTTSTTSSSLFDEFGRMREGG